MLVDFPALVRVQLGSPPVDAGEIAFAAEDGVTVLDHAIASYDPLHGELSAWVRVPRLRYPEGTSLFVYHASKHGPAASRPAPSIWSAGFVDVWHFDDQAKLPERAVVHGAVEVVVDGKVDGGAHFGGPAA